MKKINILITAGPTREYIDPVRFISNNSTGTIGYNIAAYAQKKGHKVKLISGPTNLEIPKGVKRINIVSTRDLKKAVDSHYDWADCVICTGAVCDYRPKGLYKHKIKKGADSLELKLTRNPDILKLMGDRKKDKVLVGFALETRDLLRNSQRKFKDKNLDLIVANKLSPENNPFGQGKTDIILIDKNGQKSFQHINKERLARIILDTSVKLCYSLFVKK